jgi:GntR family transcriptional regulator, transcriptional repressor for pyruvate dehydrogenase complex
VSASGSGRGGGTGMPDAVFAAIRRQPKLADQVVEAIEALIAQGRLISGEKLPPERQLCEQFGVSRTAVREAVRSLEAKGLLEVRAGGGTWIRPPSAAPASQLLGLAMQVAGTGVTWVHVLEARRALEVQNAALAAERRTEKDLVDLRGAIHEMRARQGDAEGWARADVRFHDALAIATGNPLMPLLLGAMQDALVAARLQAHRLATTPPTALQHHQNVLRAVESGDVEAARQAMRDHLDESEATLTRAREGIGKGQA